MDKKYYWISYVYKNNRNNDVGFENTVTTTHPFKDELFKKSDGYDYYKILLTGQGADKIKTLLFIKKTFSCDFAQAKAYLEAVPLLVYKGTDLGAVKIEDQLKSIGADFERRKISLGEFL